MAQINKNALLCICVPIYNRMDYLDRMLSRFLEDKDLFDNTINLIISDNCSQEDLQSCCKTYQDQGLNLFYHRNKNNLGSNGNFIWCFNHTVGKYTWLLGSDDIPQKGNLRKLLNYLKDKEYGLFHLSVIPQSRDLTFFKDGNQMMEAVSYWITFMSSNILLTSTLTSIDLIPYKETWLVQVPAYLNACYSSSENAILDSRQFFESNTDAANNGGYNIFEVFVSNLYGIYNEFVLKDLLSKETFNRLIKVEYKDFLVGYIINLLIFRQESNFELSGGWTALRNYYGNKLYAYYYLFVAILKRFFKAQLSILISIQSIFLFSR